MDSWINIIGTLGFPICACIWLAIALWKILKEMGTTVSGLVQTCNGISETAAKNVTVLQELSKEVSGHIAQNTAEHSRIMSMTTQYERREAGDVNK